MTMTDDELLHQLAFALAAPPTAPSEADEAALRALVREPIDGDRTDVATVVALRPRQRRRLPRWAVAVGAGALVVGTPVVAAAAMGSDAPGPVGRLGEVFHPHSPDTPPTTVPAQPEPDATLDGQGGPSPAPADPPVGVVPSESDDSSGSSGEVDDDRGDQRGETSDDDHSGQGSGYDDDNSDSGSGSGSGSDGDGYEEDHDWSGSGSDDSDRSGSGGDDSDRSGSDSSGSGSSGSGTDESSSGSGSGGGGDD
jgi:hypothetical protein